MSNRKSDSPQARDQARSPESEAGRLAQILGRSAWTLQEAQLVLQAQVQSGQNIAAFAAQHGLTATRLYNWKTRSKQAPVATAPEPETDSEEPAGFPSAVDAGLDLQQPGERHAYQYLLRATRSEDRMWNLLSLRRSGSVLLCVVRWVQRTTDPTPYSLVSLDLTQPALWWNCFATPEAAHQALEQRCAGGTTPAGPALRRVLIRSPAARSPSPEPSPAQTAAQTGSIPIWMPAGARIQIPADVSQKLLRTVLRTLRTPPC